MANLSRPAISAAALVALAAMLAAGCAGSAQAGGPAASAKSCDQHKSAGPDTVAIKTVKCPAPAGSTTKLTITVSDSSGHPVTGAAVTLRSLMPSMGMSSDQITAFPSGSGYQASVLLGMSGTWQLAVTVVAPGVKAVTVQFAVPAS